MEHQSFIIDTLRHIIQLLGIAVDDIVIEQDEHAASFRVIIKTKDSAILIGEHGARLLALNHVMKRIAAPMIGGILTSFILELVVYPAIYEIWKWHFELKHELAVPAPTEGVRA